MKKLTLFLVALLAFSCLRAEITYELNGGKYNDYGWTSKADMFAAFMTDAGATGFETLEYYMQQTDPLKSPNICAKLTNAAPALIMTKWAWLKTYIEQAHADQAADGASALPADGTGSAWRYAVGAFFVEIQHTGWPKSADFTELGKDAAYIPAWGQNYGNPIDPTEEVTLVEPYRAGYLFDGWYASADFSGEKVTKVDQNTTGTLYAKWVLDGIVYELNGGKYNDYGWTNKADICLALEADYNTAAGASKDWVKKEDGVIKYNINGVWKTEAEAKGSAANISGFIHANTWTKDGKFSTLILTTQVDKYGWLKDMITANRKTQSITTELNDAAYRQEVSAFFLCSPTLTANGVTSSSYENTGDYEDYQPYWGQAFPNPKHPTAEVVLNNPVKTGYKFLGWYDNEACSGTPITKVDQNTKGTLYAKWVLDGIVYELNGGQYNDYGWTCKADICYDLQVDYNAAYGKSLAWAKKEDGVVYYNINGTWMTETEAKGQEAAVTGFLQNVTYNTTDNLLTLIETTKAEKYAWLKDVIVANRSAQSLSTTLNEGYYRLELSGFFLCSAGGNSPMQHSSFASSGDLASFQAYWGQSFPNPEHPTAEVTLNPAIKVRHTFEGWYAAEDFSGSPVIKVDENYAGTLYAKWSLAPVLYNLNGGQYNEYGWESKKDVYDDFIADWNTYSGTTRKTAQYEDQLGIGKSNEGIPTTITTVNGVNHRDNLAAMFTNPTYSAKWGWLATYIDAVATQQSKTQPTTDANKLTFSLGNFFGEDNNHAADYIGAVDFTGDARYLVSAQLSCSFTLPNPTYPTSEVTINNPTKEGYIFDGWYANADFSGAKVTKVNADTKGTLYAKWTEKVIIIDDKAVNSTALAEYNGQIVTAKVTRAFNNDSYKTLTLPFDMTEAQIKAVFGETAIVHEFTSVGEANDMFYLHFDPTTIIEAGKPYIIQLPVTGDYDAKDGFTIEGVTINTTLNPVVQGAITMKPILDGGGRLDQASQYWLASDNYLYSAGAHPTALLGLRAYFINSTGRPIRARVVYGANEATSIPTVVAPEDNVRKVLKDGQIIIIRGEKQYNIQGQVIE